MNGREARETERTRRSRKPVFCRNEAASPEAADAAIARHRARETDDPQHLYPCYEGVATLRLDRPPWSEP
jgi:hypothetical protein